MTHTTRRAWRPLVSATAIVATALTGSLLGTGPAQSAPPVEDCAVAFPVSDLAAGQAVTGLTVSSGTTPEGFTGEVLGVLHDGIAPGLDMVMVRLGSPEIDRVGGIWAGMSGSPVYADDGRLIGAVAYGLAWGPSPVAGVTPFERMDDYLAAPVPTVTVPAWAARRIEARTDITAAEAGEGFEQLPMPLGVSGVSPARLADVKDRPYLASGSRSMGAAPAAAGPGAETIVAGGNLAFGAAYGEVTIAAVGTATSVCHDQVVGFGHPATFRGTVSAGMHPADAVYVQEDPAGGAFKVANLGAPVGTITDDHQTGITGAFGPLPPASPVTSTLSYGSRTRTGVSQALMPDYLASTVYYQVVGNHDSVVDGHFPGSEVAHWVITGSGPSGAPFTIDLADRFASSYDISEEASYVVADMAWYLADLPGVEVDAVTVDGTVFDDAMIYSLRSVERRTEGSWQKVGRGERIKVRAGSTLRLRAVLESDSGARRVLLPVDVPRRLAGERGYLEVMGGGETYSPFWRADTLSEFLKLVRAEVRNDSVVAGLVVDLGRTEYQRTVESAPTDKVVQGEKSFRVVVTP